MAAETVTLRLTREEAWLAESALRDYAQQQRDLASEHSGDEAEAFADNAWTLERVAKRL